MGDMILRVFDRNYYASLHPRLTIIMCWVVVDDIGTVEIGRDEMNGGAIGCVVNVMPGSHAARQGEQSGVRSRRLVVALICGRGVAVARW